MNMKLVRSPATQDNTPGTLFVDDKFECYTVEDLERVIKVHGKTAIPKGCYRVIVNFSLRFKRMLPLLLDVPNFEGVRIHPGNTSEDTEGCILPGTSNWPNGVSNSRKTFDALFKKIDAASKRERIFIEIV